MTDILCATGFIGFFMLVGIFLRAKVKFLQKMLVPVSVIGGFIGLLFMNFIIPYIPVKITSPSVFSTLTGALFTLSFISIGLTDGESGKTKGKGNKNTSSGKQTVQQGAIGLSCIWCMLYAITPVIGGVLIYIIGKGFDMDSMYGMLIPFAFCQGPGQATTYGGIFENTYGYVNAQQVAVTFSIIGFLVSFLIGVPLARYGLKKGIVKSNLKINDAVERGFLHPEEQRESMGKVTSFSGSIESLTIHFGLIGLTYLASYWMTKGLALIPVLGETFSGMHFLWGLFAGYIIKFVMKKLKVFYIIDKKVMSKITGFFSDYLILTSFLSITLSVLGNWLIPMIVECIVMAAITFGICYYFGGRLGSDHDFERVLGIYGESTGTTPSGIALVRIVDDKMQTGTMEEIGLQSSCVPLTIPSFLLISFAGMGRISVTTSMLLNIGLTLLFIVCLKIFKLWNHRSFSLRKGEKYVGEVSINDSRVVGQLRAVE